MGQKLILVEKVFEADIWINGTDVIPTRYGDHHANRPDQLGT